MSSTIQGNATRATAAVRARRFRYFGTRMGIIVPLVTGLLIRDGSFAPVILLIGAMGLLSVVSCLFVIGKLERMR